MSETESCCPPHWFMGDAGDPTALCARCGIRADMTWPTTGAVLRIPTSADVVTVPGPTFDPVERPAHYNSGAVEAIDASSPSAERMAFVAYCRGNAVKYRCPSSDWRPPDLGLARLPPTHTIDEIRAYRRAHGVDLGTAVRRLGAKFNRVAAVRVRE